MTVMRASLLGLLLLAACAGPDLPPGWEGARTIPLTQSECEGSPFEPFDERVEAGSAGTLEVLETHFRCAQEVEAFLAEDEERVLVQPIDMNPSLVPDCDCLYDLSVTLEGLAAGVHRVEVFRRWDALNDPNDPVLLGAVEVSIP
jgi:hypothetical protein